MKRGFKSVTVESQQLKKLYVDKGENCQAQTYLLGGTNKIMWHICSHIQVDQIHVQVWLI